MKPKQARIPKNIFSNRINGLILLMILVMGFYAFKLLDIQVINASNYLAQAEENRISNINIPTQRGIIYDRNGYVLAQNIASFNVTITPAYLPDDIGNVQEIYRQLSRLINVPVSAGDFNEQSVRNFSPCQTDFGITEIVAIQDTNAPYSAVRIACNIDQKTAMMISENSDKWPGVTIEVEAVRDYPTGSLTAALIGFLGPVPAALQEQYEELGFVSGRDKVGYAGAELSLQDFLGGKNGLRVVEVDAAGKVLRDIEAPIDPVPGNNITLTIDTRLQSAAEAALVSMIQSWNAYLNRVFSENGVVIAMNPKTGEILAMVSYPTYENNRMARLIPYDYWVQLNSDPNRPLFNHAISAELPPGSVFKMPTALGALNEKVVTPEQTVFDPGKITILQQYSPNDPGIPRDYVCWEKTGHGYQNWLQGVMNSCNVYFYKIGGGYQNEVPDGGLGIWRMGEYAKALGYGVITGIELPGEQDGLIPNPTWKRIAQSENWATGDTYISVMGQGYVLATPLQVLVSFSTIVNDGKLMKPTIIREVKDSEGNVVQSFQPQLVRDITKDPVIQLFGENGQPTGELVTVAPWILDLAQQGMRLVVTEGTAERIFATATIQTGGKTGTAEYCDNVAQEKNLCQPGNWPAHAWYVGYAPYDDPEIAVVAFVYNGTEGATVAAPIVRQVLEAYFEFKAIDAGSIIN